MTDYANMTDAELNRETAEVLGMVTDKYLGGIDRDIYWGMPGTVDPIYCDEWNPCDNLNHVFLLDEDLSCCNLHLKKLSDNLWSARYRLNLYVVADVTDVSPGRAITRAFLDAKNSDLVKSICSALEGNKDDRQQTT